MYERTFTFSNGSIKESALGEIPVMNLPGILAS